MSDEGEGDFAIQDDSAPCHRASVVQYWFASRDTMLLEWPGQSPDLTQLKICGTWLRDFGEEKSPQPKRSLFRVSLQLAIG